MQAERVIDPPLSFQHKFLVGKIQIYYLSLISMLALRNDELP